MCLAHMLSMLSFATWPTLLPQLQPAWSLSNTEAGLISGIFFAGYMALAPVLSGLTDRVDARRVYAASALATAVGAAGFALFAQGTVSALLFQCLMGAGVAGTYMPGLKLLTDHVTGPKQSRSVSFYTATFGIGGGLSIVLAGVMATRWGWQSAFLLGAAGPVLAGALVWLCMPQGRVHPREQGGTGRLREVFIQPDVGRYILGYSVHCWELFGSRAWLVAFLTYAAAGMAHPSMWTPVLVAGVANALVSPLASILGNELAMRHGRERLIWNVMFASALLTCVLGFLGEAPWLLLVAASMLHMAATMGDSGALTSGVVSVSRAPLRGASLAVHAALGFGAGFVAPLVFGAVLDAAGGNASARAWGWAFVSLALPALAGSFLLRPRGRRQD
jgi:MFS family permease